MVEMIKGKVEKMEGNVEKIMSLNFTRAKPGNLLVYIYKRGCVCVCVCVSVCPFPMHAQTTEPIFIKFCMGVLLHSVSVLGYINWAWVGVRGRGWA